MATLSSFFPIFLGFCVLYYLKRIIMATAHSHLESLAARVRRGALVRQDTDVLSISPLDQASSIQDDQLPSLVSDRLMINNLVGCRKNESKKNAQDVSSREHLKESSREKRDFSDWGATLGNEELSVAERLSLAVKIHAFLCDAPTHEKLQERVDDLAHPELLVPLLILARVLHPLNYVALRLVLLFTHTSKSLLLLSRLGAIPTVMICLSRPQELECIRYCLEILR